MGPLDSRLSHVTTFEQSSYTPRGNPPLGVFFEGGITVLVPQRNVPRTCYFWTAVCGFESTITQRTGRGTSSPMRVLAVDQ